MVDVSVFGSSRRPHLLQRLYDTLSNDIVSFEMVFAGPALPDFKLPDNLQFIQTGVKPAQALEIARRECTGHFVINTADDLCFPTNALTRHIAEWEKTPDNELLMLSGAYGIDGVKRDVIDQHYTIRDRSSAIVPLCGFVLRSTSDLIGSIDRNFQALYWDLDRAMRLYELGGRVQIIQDLLIYEDSTAHFDGRLLNTYLGPDRTYLDSLYGEDGRSRRKKPVEAFDDVDLRKVSQGNKGAWI